MSIVDYPGKFKNVSFGAQMIALEYCCCGWNPELGQPHPEMLVLCEVVPLF